MGLLELTRTETLRHGTPYKTITATVMKDGSPTLVAIEESHVNWGKAGALLDSFLQGNLSKEEVADELYSLVNMVAAVEQKMLEVDGILDGRMKLQGERLLVDGDPMDPVLEAHLLRLLREDGTPKDTMNWKAFAKFVDNLYGNMSEFVRKQLFGWLSYENLHGDGFVLTEDGCFVGYKGCAGTPEAPVSVNTGSAVVDGVQKHGAIPNPVGALVEMPRSSVTADPQIGCSYGLHVGTKAYATKWAPILLKVKVNPRDVVSVPTECSAQKIRTCRYKVLELVATGDTPTATWVPQDTPADDQGEVFSLENLTPGMVVSFSYAKKDGERKTYEVEVAETSQEKLGGLLTNGDGYRSFFLNKVSSLTVLSEPEEDLEETPVEEVPVEEAPEELVEGEVYKVYYTPRGAYEEKAYLVRVDEITPHALYGVRLPSEDHITLLKERLGKVTPLHLQEPPVEEEAPEFTLTPGASYEVGYSTLDRAAELVFKVKVLSVAEGRVRVMNLVDGGTLILSLDRIVLLLPLDSGAFEVPAPEDAESPGSEEEEEIKRHGYGL